MTSTDDMACIQFRSMTSANSFSVFLHDCLLQSKVINE